MTMDGTIEIAFPAAELTRLRQIAASRGDSVDELIKHVVEEHLLEPSVVEGLNAVRQMSELALPVSNWERMEQESQSDPCGAR